MIYRKKVKNFLKKLIILIFIIALLFSSCGFAESQEDKAVENSKFIGVWFTYKEIEELCINSSNSDELKKNVNEIFVQLKKYKVNNIFLHARAFDDCFYKSLIFPVSEYCRDNYGNLKFDILECFIELAKEQNIAIHAWINPYRIRNDNKTEKIPVNSFAGKIFAENKNDERIIITDNSIFYNPAYPEVQNYVLNGVREILENYEVDGIHIDDYFYPAQNEKIDKFIYNDYIRNGGTLDIADFRRNSVNTLVSSIYSLVKSFDDNILVSISPSADINKNYNESYAAIKLWASTDGYADILIPQLYYGFEHSTMPFDKMLIKWAGLQNDKTKIVIGLAVYKSGTEDGYAKQGSNEWIENCNIISEQIKSINNINCYGWAYFSSSYLLKDINEILNSEKENIITTVNSIGNIM